MAKWNFPREVTGWIESLAEPLHARIRRRLLTVCLGLLFAMGRRTAASWFRAAQVGRDFKTHYYFLGSLGRNIKPVASRLLRIAEQKIPFEGRILLALDDTPTKRFGPEVQGAGIHYNPTPGPAGHKYLYGHNWVTIELVGQHPQWGTIGLPLRADMYIRRDDLKKIAPWNRPKFQTKLEQAAEQLEWAAEWLKYRKIPLWVAADGAYAKRPFLRRAASANVWVVSRLRKDAALCDLPPPKSGGRGRPRKYGANRISLAKRAGHSQGWQTEEFTLYGEKIAKKYKTFLATYRPAGGLIRVVLVKEEDGWVAYFSTKPDASVEEILTAVAGRSSIEQVFHDVKEVHGAGQQQVRHLFASIGAFNLNLWMHTLIELWAWPKTHKQLCDRRDRPWDDATRRPSHADRRNALRRMCIQEEFLRIAAPPHPASKIRSLLQRLTALVT